ncbi:LysM domain-containing protein [Hirsutella rhossiliensis]
MAVLQHWLLGGLILSAFAAVGARSHGCMYTVVAGDSCWAIAVLKYGITLEEFYRLNPSITNHASCPIFPGQLYNPRPVEVASMIKISVDKSVSLQNLRQWNGLPGPSIFILETKSGSPNLCQSTQYGDTCFTIAENSGVKLDRLNPYVGNWTDPTPPKKVELMPSTEGLKAAKEVAEKGIKKALEGELGLTEELAKEPVEYVKILKCKSPFNILKPISKDVDETLAWAEVLGSVSYSTVIVPRFTSRERSASLPVDGCRGGGCYRVYG